MPNADFCVAGFIGSATLTLDVHEFSTTLEQRTMRAAESTVLLGGGAAGRSDNTA